MERMRMKMMERMKMKMMKRKKRERERKTKRVKRKFLNGLVSVFFPNVLDETVKNLNAQPHHLPTRTDHRQFDRELQWHSWREMKLEYLWLLHCL